MKMMFVTTTSLTCKQDTFSADVTKPVITVFKGLCRLATSQLWKCESERFSIPDDESEGPNYLI